MERRPTAQDISWFLDLRKNKQLDLDPPYQRRSVWTPKDRRYFLDTIFHNYPSPAVFLHKVIDKDGQTTYHVVDGKQRLETIFRFVDNKMKMPDDFGDDRLNDKRWRDIDEVDLRSRFWNYQIPVEMIDFRDAAIVKNVFDRLNRNSRKLTPQEMRHARFDGWFIQRAEREADDELWKTLGFATRARMSRMSDVQFVSELLIVALKGNPQGFSQDQLDTVYAEYDDPAELDEFDVDEFETRVSRGKTRLTGVEAFDHTVTTYAKGAVSAVYTLWCVLSLSADLPGEEVLAARYAAFMEKVEELSRLEPGTPLPEGDDYRRAAEYRDNARGAATEAPQRSKRHEILRAVLGAE